MHRVEEKSSGLLGNRTLEYLSFIFAMKFSLVTMVTLWIGVLHRSGTDVIRVCFLELQNCRIICIERNYRQSSSWSPCSSKAKVKITSSCCLLFNLVFNIYQDGDATDSLITCSRLFFVPVLCFNFSICLSVQI